MSKHKGAVSLPGMTSLIVAAMVITLSMLLSSFVLVKSNVTTDVFAQMDSRNRQFESLATHSHITSYNQSYSKLVDYLENPTASKKNKLEQHFSSAASFINQESTTIQERQYYIELERPNSDLVNVSTSETDETYYTIKSIIASPKKNSAVLTTSIGG